MQSILNQTHKIARNWLKVQRELEEIQRKALEATQKKLLDSIERTESTPKPLLAKSNIFTKALQQYTAKPLPIIKPLPKKQIVNDDFFCYEIPKYMFSFSFSF